MYVKWNGKDPHGCSIFWLKYYNHLYIDKYINKYIKNKKKLFYIFINFKIILNYIEGKFINLLIILIKKKI